MEQPIRSSWESARGELEDEWTWGEALAAWFLFLVVGALAALVAVGLVH